MKPARFKSAGSVGSPAGIAGPRVRARSPRVDSPVSRVGAAALRLYFGTRIPNGSETRPDQTSGLSDATREILKGLKSPVEIRFYSLLDPAASSDSLRGLSGRVDGLLSEYQSEGGGKIKLMRSVSTPATAGAAAFADGLQPFNLDKGDGCYLGLTVECNGRKESFARLLPEWELALESDISRAIARVSEATAATPANASPSATDPAVIAEVKRALPNFDSVTVKQGSELLRDAAPRSSPPPYRRCRCSFRRPSSGWPRRKTAAPKPKSRTPSKASSSFRPRKRRSSNKSPPGPGANPGIRENEDGRPLTPGRTVKLPLGEGAPQASWFEVNPNHCSCKVDIHQLVRRSVGFPPFQFLEALS